MKTNCICIVFFIVLFSCKKSQTAVPKSITLPQETQEVKETDSPKVSKPAKATIPIEFGLVGDSTIDFGGEMLAKQLVNTKFNNRKWQGIPSIEIDQTGAIYIAWYTGGKGEEAGNYITVSVSKDNGESWSQNELIINPTISPLRFFDPCLWKDKYGEICLSWSKSNNNWDGKGGVFYSRIRLTDSVEFSKPRFLAEGVMMNKPVLSYQKNFMLYPISAWSKTPGTFIYKSMNDALSFNLAATIEVPKTVRNIDEHTIIQLADLSYLCILRGIDGIYVTKSSDILKWSIPTKLPGIGATNAGRVSLSRLNSGNIALVLNNATDRSNLKIFISDDECTTWKYSMLIDKRIGVSYPNLTQDASGNIHVTYDYDRYKSMDINHVIFTESDVINNDESKIKRHLLH